MTSVVDYPAAVFLNFRHMAAAGASLFPTNSEITVKKAGRCDRTR